MWSRFFQRAGLALALLGGVAALYFFELSQLRLVPATSLPSLDDIESGDLTRLWEKFYRVRAHIIDGQSASFDIPPDLQALAGETITLKGAVDFFSNGCVEQGGKIAIRSFILVPTLDIVDSSDIVPEVEMRWTVIVDLRDEWVLSREEMICAEATVTGRFRIDTSHPYDAAFFIDGARCELAPGSGT